MLVVCFLLASVAATYADSAWVLWEHVRGVVDGRVQDFWLLRAAGETRKECRQLANEQISLEMGELSGVPDWLKAEPSRPGWLRERDGAGYKDRAPEGQRPSFLQHDFECWPTGTDPRPRPRE
jgi:hypothetical protein